MPKRNTGVDSAHNREVLDKLDTYLEDFVELFAEKFKARVEDKTPEQKGTLKDSYELDIQPTYFTLGNTQPYFTYVENGTYKMPPAAMVARTLQEKEIIANEVKQELE